MKIEKLRHPFWPEIAIENEAARRFELYGRRFMEETLILSKKLRPYGTWGYYAYPYCFNMNPNNMKEDCPGDVKKENDRITWLFKISDALYPSVYLREKLNTIQQVQLVKGRIKEAKRIGNQKRIIPYYRYKYTDTKNYVDVYHLKQTLTPIRDSNVDEIVFWGSSKDVSSKKNCIELAEYVESTLGPTLNNN